MEEEMQIHEEIEIRELINRLIDKEIEGLKTVKLVSVEEPYEPDGEEGNIEYEGVAKLVFSY